MEEADTAVSIEYCELRKTKSDSDSADDVTIFKKVGRRNINIATYFNKQPSDFQETL